MCGLDEIEASLEGNGYEINCSERCAGDGDVTLGVLTNTKVMNLDNSAEEVIEQQWGLKSLGGNSYKPSSAQESQMVKWGSPGGGVKLGEIRVLLGEI